MRRNAIVILFLFALLFSAPAAFAQEPQDPTLPPKQVVPGDEKNQTLPATMAFVRKDQNGEEWVYILLLEEQRKEILDDTADADNRNDRVKIELEQSQVDAVNAAIGGRLKDDDIDLKISREQMREIPGRKGYFVARRVSQFLRDEASDGGKEDKGFWDWLRGD